ncbi:MAG: MlaD family protein [Treponema sp.]|nr:MlaD family protein [Treponema sp.]
MGISRYVKIALFFIVLGGTGTAYIVSTSSGMSDFNTREYETVIADATGLSTRSKIYLAGVSVGRIKSIELSGNEAIMRLAVLKNVELREGTIISRKSSSILGTSILTLEPGSEMAASLIPAGGMIPTAKESGDMGAVMGTVQDLGLQISQLLKDFQENQLALLSVSLQTFNAIAQKINDESDAELDRVSRILESTAQITESLQRVLAQGETSAAGPAGDLYVTLENIRMISDEISHGRGNMGQVIYDSQLYESILSTVQSLEVAVIKLQDTLDSINSAASSAGTVIDSAGVIVDRAVGMGMQVDTYGSYLMSAGQVQAGASIRLIPATEDRWYRVGVSSVPNGYSTRTVKETTIDGTTEVKDVIETKYSIFTVDAELARNFGYLTVRGGLLENTAGLGFDIQPIRWVSASAEVFDFGSGGRPNLRGTVTVYPFFDPDSDKPWQWIYLKGGINDSLNDSRDFFVGGGIRFADREIKGLVGLLPVLNN